ncbi:Transmembrane protein 41A-A [Hypsibius exemplaris]|uniref:Transmembrane protein 41A-A n=1 Tax=Hypsibius exemplaris TaxID=2072580 RepID=A0A1W0WYL4_HYPEX|nr:Transmembrane protein 41A-A [Hypsibius exemplaris]
MASFWFLPAIAALATFALYLLAKSAPQLESERQLDLHFPQSFDDLKNITVFLGEYKESHPDYVLLLFCAAFLWKQSFGIPGSAGLNIASGAIFGFWKGFPLSCILTAVGATTCYILSYLFGRRVVKRFFAAKLDWFRNKVHANSHNLTYYLLFLRLFPASPNWFLNIASSHIGIPIHTFFFTVLIGLMPYNFVCVHGGSILRELTSFNDIFTWTRIGQMALIACVALIPGLYLRKKARSTAPEEDGLHTLHNAKNQ